MLCYCPLVSELGGRVHGAPNHVIGGACAPGSAAYVTIVGDLAIFSVDFCILGYMLNVLHISTAGLPEYHTRRSPRR